MIAVADPLNSPNRLINKPSRVSTFHADLLGRQGLFGMSGGVPKIFNGFKPGALGPKRLVLSGFWAHSFNPLERVAQPLRLGAVGFPVRIELSQLCSPVPVGSKKALIVPQYLPKRWPSKTIERVALGGFGAKANLVGLTMHND
ncbi:MAG: Uncharacterised protein [Cellulomonadaceae bacterium TMED98]|nr:MAG: Uncharacterised protein [Cellulomonadaceae bacterium TMED98]